MADFPLGPTVFPVGTTVGVYLRRAFVGDTGPLAAAVTTAVTDANLVTSFTGLAYNTAYWAAAQLGGVWRKVAFTTDPEVLVSATTVELAAEAAARAAADASEAAARAAQAALKVDKTVSQSAVESNTPVFDIESATPGVARFEVQMQSFPNLGDGEGYNDGVWIGWNASRFAGGDWLEGSHGIYMGFERNFFDAGGDETYGVEWYVGYLTPDGSTIGPAELRPLYFRVLDSDVNDATKNVLVSMDLGLGPTSSFSIMGDVNTQTQLFVVHKTLGIFNRLPAYFTADNADAGGAGTVQIAPADGYAQLDIVAPGVGTAGSYSVVAFKDTLTYRWSIAGTTGSFEVQDSTNGGRKHMQFTPGATDTTAETILKSNLQALGKFGVNGATPQARLTVDSPTADVASLKTAVDTMRAILSGCGIFT